MSRIFLVFIRFQSSAGKLWLRAESQKEDCRRIVSRALLLCYETVKFGCYVTVKLGFATRALLRETNILRILHAQRTYLYRHGRIEVGKVLFLIPDFRFLVL